MRHKFAFCRFKNFFSQEDVMGFSKHGKFFRVSYITGPTHNLLSLWLQIFSNEDEIQIEKLHVPGSRQLCAEDVVREVCLGVENANRDLETNVVICCIQFVPSDSRPPSVYRRLAYALVRHFADQIS